MSRPRPVILDISEHQLPSQLDYSLLAQSLDWVIVRIQYGSWYQDRQFRTHLEQFKSLNVPVNVYAWVRRSDERDMMKEAEDFYQRAKEYQPSFWWLDIANHRYHEFGFSAKATESYDALWLSIEVRGIVVKASIVKISARKKLRAPLVMKPVANPVVLSALIILRDVYR